MVTPEYACTVADRLRVPQITAGFWLAKALSTALGEATSDYSVHVITPVAAVLLGFAAFVVSLAVQLSMRRYIAWTYWFAVAMVGTFGTMAADVLHVGFGVPYFISTALYAVALVLVFRVWRAVEGTLSFHTITTLRRELFYWGAVVATFAMGTALGDLSATTFGFGYFASAVLFGVLIAASAFAYRVLRANAIFCFWFAYVMTRPFGASIADGLAKPRAPGGLAFGDGPVALACALLMLCVVAYLATSKAGVSERSRGPAA